MRRGARQVDEPPPGAVAARAHRLERAGTRAGPVATSRSTTSASARRVEAAARLASLRPDRDRLQRPAPRRRHRAPSWPGSPGSTWPTTPGCARSTSASARDMTFEESMARFPEQMRGCCGRRRCASPAGRPIRRPPSGSPPRCTDVVAGDGRRRHCRGRLARRCDAGRDLPLPRLPVARCGTPSAATPTATGRCCSRAARLADRRVERRLAPRAGDGRRRARARGTPTAATLRPATLRAATLRAATLRAANRRTRARHAEGRVRSSASSRAGTREWTRLQRPVRAIMRMVTNIERVTRGRPVRAGAPDGGLLPLLRDRARRRGARSRWPRRCWPTRRRGRAAAGP